MPKLEQKYVMKPALIVWGQGFSQNSSGGKKKQFDVRAIGEGSIGDIKVCYMSRLLGKPTMWFPNRSDTNRPVQSQKRARILKFQI